MNFYFDDMTIDNHVLQIEYDNAAVFREFYKTLDVLVARISLHLEGKNALHFMEKKKGELYIRFYNREQMRQFHKVDKAANQRILRDIEKLYQKIIPKLQGRNHVGLPDYIENRLVELLYILRDLISYTEEEPRREDVKEIVDAIRGTFDEVMNYREREMMDPRILDLQKLLEKLLELVACLDYPMDLLGVYSHKELEIGLCMENIRREAGDDDDFLLKLAETVLIHELVHCVHFHYVIQRQRKADNPYTKVKRSAVYETVAETCQWLYALRMGDQKVISWMENHMKSGSFPGWGYAGAEIVKQFSNMHNQKQSWSEEFLIGKIVELSKKDWKDAYAFIEFMKMLNVEMR